MTDVASVLVLSPQSVLQLSKYIFCLQKKLQVVFFGFFYICLKMFDNYFEIHTATT